MGFLKVGAFALIAFCIAFYASAHKNDAPKVASTQVAAVALAPVPVPLTVEGTIVFDNAPASDMQPYVLYGEKKADGSSSVKTKRLVLPSRYVCQQGDVPCAVPTGVA